MLIFLTSITLFLLPLVFWPTSLRFELPKIILFFVASFFLIIWFLKKENFGKIKNKAWFLWVGLLFLSTTLNNQIISGLVGYGYRHQGVIFFLVLGLWMIAFGFLKKSDRKKISWWISLAVIIQSLIVLGQWLTIKLNFPILSYNQRPIGTFGEPNSVAGFLLLGLPVSLGSPFFLISLPLVFLGILATGSKAGLGALMAEMLAFFILKDRRIQKKKIFIVLVTLVIIALGIFGVFREKEVSFFENRWDIWKMGLRAFAQKPILGYGAEGIIEVYEHQFQIQKISLENLMIDRTHNLFLDLLLFSGILGLGVFLKWFWENAKKLNENWRVMALVGFSVFSFFQPIGVVHWVYFIFFLSLP